MRRVVITGLGAVTPLGLSAEGNCLGGVLQLERGCEAAANGGGTRLPPYFIVGLLPNSVAGFISIETGARGPCLTVSQA